MKKLLFIIAFLVIGNQLQAQNPIITKLDLNNGAFKAPIFSKGTLGLYLSKNQKEYFKLTPAQKTVVDKCLNFTYSEYKKIKKRVPLDLCVLFPKWCETLSFDPPTTNYYAAINETKQYATAADGSALQINIQTPADIATNKIRPVVIFTHGTTDNERNDLQISSYTSAIVGQGIIVVNFNFYGNNNTRTNNDGKHLTAQYAMVIDFLRNNAATYHINVDAIIAGGVSGSAANAVYVAIQKNLFGCLIQCGGRNIGLKAIPANGAKLSFASVQQQNDTGFGGYKYSTADAESGASHNGDAWTENTALAKVGWPGNIKYFTAWGDAGGIETMVYLRNLYGNNLTNYGNISVLDNTEAHCPKGSDWDNFMQNQPKQMFNDRGITW